MPLLLCTRVASRETLEVDKFASDIGTSDITVGGLEFISNLDGADLTDCVLLATDSKPAQYSHQDELTPSSRVVPFRRTDCRRRSPAMRWMNRERK